MMYIYVQGQDYNPACVKEHHIMDNNTFSEGIAPGGLRDKAEIKLLVCYLLKTLNKSLSRTQINEILQEYKIANYFEVNQALSELISGGQVTADLCDGDELITITGKAMFDVASIERSLPKTVREKAVNAALKVLTRERIKRESRVEVTKLEHGYHVHFTVFDMETELLKLTVYVTDESQVEVAKNNFFNNAVTLYSDVISLLTVE